MNSPKKKILFLSPFFYPELISTGKFNSDIVIALRDNGYKVTVICSHPIYPKWIVKKSTAQLKGINIIRGGGYLKYSKKPLIRRLILELWFTLYVLKNVHNFRKKIDVIIGVIPPSLAFYFSIPYIGKNVKKIAIIHDLQEVYSKKKKGLINRLINFFIHNVEGKTIRNFDKVIFLSNEMKETAKDYYKLSVQKLYVQYPFSTLKSNNLTNDLNEVLPIDKINIVYSGALGEKQNPKGVYDFFNFASQEMHNVLFHFFSQGQIFENLKITNKNDKIKFHDLVPRENIEELYRRSSVQLIPQLPNTSLGSLPSKLPNLLASGCKILFITDSNSEIEYLFKKYNLNKVITSWDNDIILQSLRELLNQKTCNIKNQQRVAEELFSIDSMVKTILD